MTSRLFNPIPWFSGGAVLAAAGGYLWLIGSAVVVDDTGGVASAVIIDGSGREHRLHRLWGGYFYGVPSRDGTIEVRCRNGVRTQRGYVTSHMHTKLRVVGQPACAQIVEVF